MKSFRRIATLLLLSVFACPAMMAQDATVPTAEEFEQRYNTLVSKLGPAGVGIETLLDRWEAAYPTDERVTVNRFAYYLAKSQKSEVVPKKQETFLGNKPVLTLNDSLGAKVNYFQETFFDDMLFGQAIKCIDQVIRAHPDRLDLRLSKVTAYTLYEKESPDMAMSDLKALIDYNFTQHPQWSYPGAIVDKDFFDAAIQEYCFVFFRYACTGGYDAFRDISLKMLQYEPNNYLFLDNMGSYFLVAQKDHKTALKYYSKVLKAKPDDITAIKNSMLIARRDKDVKSEKKFLSLLAKYGSEQEKMQAQAKLDYYDKK